MVEVDGVESWCAGVGRLAVVVMLEPVEDRSGCFDGENMCAVDADNVIANA
jgi:hypothetical protein